eukprot:TRINITY_DN93576_c0_g1_i1.p1 TRINITY_DN93576_c0_g1~~TRINITY_DN93576_c0_g1_i1.p1  ORF type:complete len:457 (-),score=38.08 TRINITY_DN93576_c0_g1_i1:217-1587(-)
MSMIHIHALAILFLVRQILAEDIWDCAVKLVPVDAKAPGQPRSSSGEGFYAFVLRTWRSCSFAWAIPVTKNALAASNEDYRSVGRCGRGVAFNCRYYEAGTLERKTGLVVDPSIAGYLITDGMWAESGLEADACKTSDSFIRVTHPLRSLHPQGFGPWIAERLQDKGLALATSREVSRSLKSFEELAATALSEVCVENIDDESLWDDLFPPKTAAPQMLVVGCADMRDNPTQSLLRRGSGGLFVDADRQSIRWAKYLETANRKIINVTVTRANLPELLHQYRAFVGDVQVVQMDIDSADAPLLLAILEQITPKVVVVEVRNFLPFPFKYAFLSGSTDSLAWGGATLNYWLTELGVRGYELYRMDSLDAVFVRSHPIGDRRRHYLSILACYLNTVLRLPRPASFLRDLDSSASGGGAEQDWYRLQNIWMEDSPLSVIDAIWTNLTSWRGDLRFHLDV